MTSEQLEQAKAQAINSYKEDGKYLVIAGPGTGKTFTVTKRIEAILNDKVNGASPDRILCLTFSDAAAKEMKKKLQDFHVANSAGVNIYTYHSFCLDLMEQNPSIFDMETKKLITPIQKQAIVKECLDELKDKIVYNRTEYNLYGQLDDIVKGLEAIKHNRLTIEQFNDNLKNNPCWIDKYSDCEKVDEEHNKKIKKIEELLIIYQKYQEKSSEFIDFDDMINNVLDRFERDVEFLQEVASKYDFILVDEYQDTNKSQNEIVFNLAKYCKNILLVGDDDQIIYTFQGASLDTIEKFLAEFPETKIFCLRENRRSTNTILRVSEELAKLQDEYIDFYINKPINGCGVKRAEEIRAKYNYGQRKLALRLFSKPQFSKPEYSKSLIAMKEELKVKDVPVVLNEYLNEEQEKLYIVKQIEEIINSEKCPSKLSDIAVLVKTNKEAEDYASSLKERGIQVQIARGKNIFKANSVKLLVSYMQFFNDLSQYNSDKLYTFLLSKPFHINPSDYKILNDKKIKDYYGSLIDKIKYMIKLSDEVKSLKGIDEKKQEYELNKKYILKEKDKFQKLVDDYYILDNYRQAESIKNLVHQMASVTGILSCYINLEVNRKDNIDAIKKLIDVADEFSLSEPTATFPDFVRYINSLLSAEIEVLSDKTDKPLNAVQLTTLHSSKGREFEYVFMPNLTNKKYESSSESVKETVPLASEDIVAVEDEIYDKLKNYHRIEDKEKQTKFLNCLKLLYVGITRAKHTLVLSYSGQKSYFIEKLEDSLSNTNFLVSKSITEPADTYRRSDSYEKELAAAIEKIESLKSHIKPDVLEEFNSAFNKIKEIKNVLSFTITPDEAVKYDYDFSAEFAEYIDENLQEIYSPSSLNTYLKCPKQYFYRYILHLAPAKIQEIKENFASEYGTAIHFALEQMVIYAKENGNMPCVDFLLDKFDEKISELIKEPDSEAISNNKEHIKNYYEKIKTEFKKDYSFFDAEMKLEFDGNDFVEIDNVKFKGSIDRLDINNDSTYSIIDYKTGTSAKKANDVAPNKSHEDYYNQLALYRYLLETKLGKKVKNVELVQPQFLDKSFHITSLEGDEGLKNCEKVKDKFIQAVNEIKAHKFECADKCSPFCDYKAFCKSKII